MYKKPLIATILLSILLLGLSSSTIADQPKMQKALDALIVAEKQLNKGTHDKGGHRLKALKLVKKAQKQVRKAIKFDRKH